MVVRERQVALAQQILIYPMLDDMTFAMTLIFTEVFTHLRHLAQRGRTEMFSRVALLIGWTWREAPVLRSGSLHTREQASCEKPVPASHCADVVLRSERVAATPDCLFRS